MFAFEEPKASEKFRVSLCIIIIVISIIRLVLSYIDKQQLDLIFKIDIIASIVLIIDIILNIIIKCSSLRVFFFIITGILWLTNFIIPLFAYQNYVRRDYFGVNIFLIIIRIFAVFAFIGISIS